MSNQTNRQPNLLARLCVGFSAEIWKCEYRFAAKPPRQVAMRIYHGCSDDEANQQELVRLRRILSFAHIPGMPDHHDIGVWLGRLYVVTALADADCNQLVNGSHRVEPVFLERAIQVVGETAFSLDSLHERGFIHGSVSPEHILIVRGRAALTGFSLLHAVDSRIPDSRHNDLTVSLCMSPEMRSGTAQPASDQYALAATYLGVRIGRLPLGDSRWPHGYLDGIGSDEARILSKALATAPSERFPSCVAFANELLAVLKELKADKGDRRAY
jgi:serine/threonine protein kinase